MPNFLFASNNVSQFPASQINTVQGHFDINRVPYGITLPRVDAEASCLPFPRTETNETWLNFRYSVATTYSNINGSILFMRDSSTQVDVLHLNKIEKSSPFATLTISNGVSSQTVNVNSPLPSASDYTVSIRLRILLTEMQATVWIDGTQVCEVTLLVNQGGVQHPDIIRLCGGGQYLTNYPTFSEIIVADGDTRNMRLNMLRPVLPGTYADWEGSILNLADDDTTSGMLSNTAGDKVSYTLSGYTGSNVISGVISVTTGSHGLNGPENLNHFLRQGGVDYSSGNLAVDDTLSTQVVNWLTNPSTTLPWTETDLDGIEFGLESVA